MTDFDMDELDFAEYCRSVQSGKRSYIDVHAFLYAIKEIRQTKADKRWPYIEEPSDGD